MNRKRTWYFTICDFTLNVWSIIADFQVVGHINVMMGLRDVWGGSRFYTDHEW